MRYQGKRRRRKNRLMGMLVKLLASLLILCAVFFVVTTVIKPKFSKNTSEESKGNNGNADVENQQENNADVEGPTEVSIRIRCAGDIMVHAGNPANQMENALQPDGTYDFSPTFKYVKKWLEDADLTLAQFEATLSNDGVYTGYPLFVAPAVLANNVKEAGVDVALFSNNHMLDSGLSGAIRTVNFLREAGFDSVAGARTETTEPRSSIVDVNGLKVGIVAFAYETQRVDGMRTMNGMYMADEAPDYINSFRYEVSDDWTYHVNDDDLALIKSEMDWCREQGVEILICYFHWGTEYQFEPDDADKELARFVIENGADIVFASHPHVVQPIEIVDGVPVYYALGNFVSNQRYETLTGWYDFPEIQSRRSEQGLIANVELTYNKETGKVTYNNVTAIPTWVDNYYLDGRYYHQIIPLLDDLDANEALQISGNAQRAKNSLEDITGFLGAEFIYKAE